jgi:MFS transporter, Spinster family, sphingosine-1-phosphate transporter
MANNRYYPRTALLLFTALNLLNYVDRSVLNGVQLRIQEEFHLTGAQTGLLTTAFFWCYMAMAPAMGWLADRYPRKYIIALGGIVWSGATLLTALTKNYPELLFRHCVVGIGEASFATIAPTFIVDLFPQERRGRVMGIFYLAIPVGTALGYVLAGQLEPRYGWKEPFYIAAIPGLILSLSILFLREPVRGQQDTLAETPTRATFKGLFRNPAYWTATLGMAAMTFALGGLSAWIPTFLSTARKMTLEQADTQFGIIAAIDGILAALAGGWLGDRLLRRTRTAYYLVSAASMAIGVPVLVFALRAQGRALIPAIAVGAFLVLFNTAPLNTAVINSVGAHIRATAIAVNIFTIHLLGDAFSPWFIGRLADRSNLESALMTTPVALGISALICFLGMRYAPLPRQTATAAEVRA